MFYPNLNATILVTLETVLVMCTLLRIVNFQKLPGSTLGKGEKDSILGKDAKMGCEKMVWNNPQL